MDKYIKIKKIGEGSFGKALLVKSKQNGRQMVVKEINMSRMSRKEREEARKETAVLAQLNHPSIVSYRESFEEIGNLYIVMDYCDGGDLYGKINAQRGMLFPETQILDWFVQLCLAVKHIHDRKILHRDIKSQNIFLTRNAIVKLGDFGIAKVLNSTVELARTCIGTPYYLSPEICENKPYNNKSDIWSIGCVLYELTTLKHAFEAGNMKNLVLKIIRGSYPPVSPKYSYELRNLIAQLFKRNPRDRPSINSVLRKPLLTKRIQRFLSDSEFQDEFSHTVMHGQKIRKALPPGPTPARAPAVSSKSGSASSKASSARKAAPVPTPRYNPASVYAPSVARRSRDKENRKSADVVRRPNSAGAPKEPVDIAKKRQELVEKERQRREAIKKKEQQFANKHKDLIERQKAARINKAREEGWKNLVDSLGSDEGDKQPDKPVAKKPTPRQVEPPLAAASPPVKRGGPVPLNERGNYDQYNAWLDKLQQDRRRTPGVAIGVGGAGGGFGGQAARRAEVASVQGANAAGNAKVVSDFLDRKKQAAQNKARAYGDMHGVAAALSPRPIHKPPAGGAAVSGRNQEEAEYLARLKQIRLQNFNERRNAKEKQGKVNPQYKPSAAADKYDADARRKKIEALRAQADERAQRLKEQLEKKRQEAFQLEQQRLRKEAKGPSKPAAPAKLVKAPIGMTAAMDAIGAGAEKEAAKSPLQKKKEEILKRLNAKPPVSERPKWGEPVKPPIAEERPKWGEADGANLGKLSLEETASAMDATSARDVVVKHDAGAAAGSSEAVSARKRWGGPAGTALNVLQGADIIESPDSTTGSKPESPETTVPTAQAPAGAPETENRAKAPIIGSTITIVRSPSKGTVVIKKVDNPENSSEIKDNKDGADLSVKPPEPVDQTNVSTDDDDADHKAVEIDKRASAEEPKENKDQEVKKSKLFEKVDLDDQEEVKDKDKGDMEVEELETKDEEEEEEDEDLQGSDSGKAEVAIGLTTGQFDVGDTKLLRTCSEPDLAKLFRTTLTLNEFFRGRTRVESVSASLDIDALVGGDLDADDDNGDDDDDDVQAVADAYAEAGAATEEQEDEDEDTESAKKAEDESQESSESADQKEKEDTEGKEDEDDDEVVDDDEDDDMETLRESMMCLLEDDNEDAKEQPISTPRKKRAKKGTKPTKGKKKRAKSRKPEDNEEENEEGPESEMSFKRQWSNSTDDDMRSLRETMASVLQESLSPVVAKARAVNKAVKKLSTVKKAPPPVSSDEPDVGPGGDNNGNSQASEGVDSEENTIVPEKESWQSDSSEEDGQFFEEDDDMFSRMEETRVKLEHELGCDTFLKAYKAVQAIHEDEDDNMEEGVTLVCSILGDDKEHLYPNILQLVMADGAFTEDND